MRLWKVLLPCLVALAMVLGALAAPASAANPAQKPTWTQGQSVGYGVHLDIGSIANLLYAGLLTNVTNGPHINKLNITGTLDIWDVDTLTGVTSSVYTLSSQSAEGLKLHFELNVTESMPVAGTYHGTTTYGCALPLPTMQNQTTAETFDATVLSTDSGTSNLTVSNLSYLGTVQDASVQANVAFTGFHLPSYNLNTTTCTETITYTNPSYTLTVNTQDQIRMLFDPAWNYFDFPISDNKTWWANTTATVGATLAGTINLQGLSSQDEAAFFANLTQTFKSSGLTVSGLSSFPIDLAKVTISAAGVPIVSNGVVRDTTVPLSAQFRATSSAETLSDGSLHATYLITDASYACPYTGAAGTAPYGFAAVYAPDFPAAGAGMIVGYQLVTCLNGSNFSTYELKNTKPADAQQNIGRTEQTYAPNPPATTNALVDFFTQSPYLGLILVAAVVVVVAALLIFRRRHKPSVMPPGAQPPVTPPPASPPPGGPGNP